MAAPTPTGAIPYVAELDSGVGVVLKEDLALRGSPAWAGRNWTPRRRRPPDPAGAGCRDDHWWWRLSFGQPHGWVAQPLLGYAGD